MTSVDVKSGNGTEDSFNFERLSRKVIPLNYEIFIDPSWNENEPTFKGYEHILLQVNEATEQVKLHGSGLTISNVKYEENGKTLAEDKVTFRVDPKHQLIVIDFAEPLTIAKSRLSLEFTGTIRDDMKGLYRSKPTNPGTDNRYTHTYVTHFEACFARRVFPCWDEPEFKATFDISLVVPKTLTGISNMPMTEEKSHPTNSEVRIMSFDKTPIMSSYLVGFAIGEFEFVECKTSEGIPCRVFTPPAKKHQGEFALDVVSKSLSFFSNYFQLPYPLPKMDLVPVADFPCGAMENWGMITFRENALLVDSDGSTMANKHVVALMISHEISHSWFGNLVTMEWWTDLWLKEGFANFFDNLCVDHIFPEYDIWTQFARINLITALELDALKFSHPIEVQVENPNEVDEIFDDISYCKGASIIRMLYHYIGPQKFREGLTLYLKRHQYANSTTEDMWRALEEVSDKPMGKVMSTWTKQKGFPLLTCSADSIVNLPDGSRNVTLSQRKFAHVDSTETNDSSWFIPFGISKGSDPKNCVAEGLVDSATITINVKGCSEKESLKINPGLTGYYRVSYPWNVLSEFRPSIQNLSLPPLDRLGLLDDLYANVVAGHESSVKLLEFLRAYKYEDDFTVWSTIVHILSKFESLLKHRKYGPESCDVRSAATSANFSAYAQSILKNIADKLGWEKKDGEDYRVTLLRPLILHKMAEFTNPQVISKSQIYYQEFLQDKKPIPADLRPPVYRAVFSDVHGDQELFNSALKQYREADLLAEKLRILFALAAMHSPDNLKQLLQFSITDQVKPQDALRMLQIMSKTKNGQEIGWQFFVQNCKYFQSRIPSGHQIVNFVKGFTENFITREMAEEVKNFFEEYTFPGADRIVQQSVENILINVAWLKRDYVAIVEYLSERMGEGFEKDFET